MLEDGLFEILDEALTPIGSTADAGESFHEPPLEVLRYYRRPVRIHRLPGFGRALGLVAVVRQPTDIEGTAEGYRRLLRRLAMAANGRYPPFRRGNGLVLGLSAVILTPEPIDPDDEALLRSAHADLGRMRTVPLGLIRVNLGQEALAFALAQGPGDLFPEPTTVVDALTPHLRRFVPPLDLGGT